MNTPWGQRQVHWGMLTTVRDSNGAEQLKLLGNSLPLWKIGWSHNRPVQADQRLRAGRQDLRQQRLQRRPSLVVRRLHDVRRTAERQVASRREADRVLLARGRSGKRRRRRRHYDVLGPNTISFEDGGYVKLREFSLSYNIGTSSTFWATGA